MTRNALPFGRSVFGTFVRRPGETSPECIDCGWDTAAIGPHGEPVWPWEYYTVRDEVWQSAGMSLDKGAGMLCVGCLEARIGRQLVAADFPPVAANSIDPTRDTGRLLRRKRASGRG